MATAARRPERIRHSLALFSIGGVLGTLAIGGGSVWASQRAGESEAMADVRAQTAVVAQTVVGPNLSLDLLAGDPTALAGLDAIVDERVLNERTLRVKLWDADGAIVYSDEPRLIGERYELENDKVWSLTNGDVVSEISLVDGPENRFEAEMADRMLEVYLPIDGPDSQPLLYESYFAMSPVNDSAARIRRQFLPVILIPLVLMLGLHLGLAGGLTRRLQRHQADRERLLRRAVESSDLERRRIAADLHDGVIQDLVGASFALSAAASSAAAVGATTTRPANGDETDLARDLRAAAAGTRRSLQSLRSLVVDIYPPNLHEHGLEAALVDLLTPAEDLGIDAALTIRGELHTWSPDRTALVYRVVQESIRNVYRHARASTLDIDIDARSPLTEVTVTDDGVGFVNGEPVDGHLGLRLMSDLTADAGASFSIESKPGAGTTIRLAVGAEAVTA